MNGTGGGVVIAIDGGNSKTDVLLVSTAGKVLGRARGPGASPQAVGVPRALEVFEGLVLEAFAAAGMPAGRTFGAHTSAYLAGLDLPQEEETLRVALIERGWSRSVRVGNDTFALLRAGTPDGIGVAVVCGAGINCVGVGADGRTHRFPALGRISGDWGGGMQLGEEALWWAVRSEDGRGPRTALLPAVLRHFGAESAREVVERLHFGRLPAKAVHELCPLLFRVAAAGDEAAQDVVDRLIEEVALLVTVSLRRLDMTTGAPAVVLGGGVLAGVNGTVIGEIERRCVKVAPRASVGVTALPPVFGAALSGLDAIGAGAPAYARLRSSVGAGD
ncbi:N-acetylglucosamine kinase [Amycolatopsis cihanbeyliensis]|uniref:N-acetylglucosamine kinase-like BadF-type ATPase n=1 Tax=Amycolatopsis cihanbeyliensis TaxID=1128664 RepID=A0A542DCP4_AMYCI|nr:BadF/BadG/BcrA/BcrD ATPase family protein [Amycolatopsis cihanbeyliensis]TQJ00846.1 N-acetylglucosamine kinase-like BadF-type ATPase [Amycolatopsis cihanbeyliensis]